MSTKQSGAAAVVAEVASQPECWRAAAALAANTTFPAAGARVAVIGCGTSLFTAQAIAAWREEAGLGLTDAFPASELPTSREYDCVVAISRSGTTTEVIHALEKARAGTTYAIVAVANTPVADQVDHAIVLPFADEVAVVQTRFPTTVLALWRAHLGHDVERLADQGTDWLTSPLPASVSSYKQFVFIGRGPAVAFANEAALKVREAALAWSESYPAMELRHGPISPLSAHSLVWSLGPAPVGLANQVRATGAGFELADVDPMVELTRIQRTAIELAIGKGLDPDRPRGLERSIVLA